MSVEIKHGGWLPYLEKIGIEERSARNWMALAGYAESKSETLASVSDLPTPVPTLADAGIDKRPRKRDAMPTTLRTAPRALHSAFVNARYHVVLYYESEGNGVRLMLSRLLWYRTARSESKRWHPATHMILGLPSLLRDPSARRRRKRWSPLRAEIVKLVASEPDGFRSANAIATRMPASSRSQVNALVKSELQLGGLIKRDGRIHAQSCDAGVAGPAFADPGAVVGPSAPANFEGDA